METPVKETEMILVVFRLGHEEFALPIASVIEILRPQKLTRMPRAPHFVGGVMNLRGKVFPVVDLKRRLGLQPAKAEIVWHAATTVAVQGAQAESLAALIHALEELDDVQHVHTNAAFQAA